MRPLFGTASRQLFRFIQLAHQELLSFRVKVSASELVLADPRESCITVIQFDLLYLETDERMLPQDAVAGMPVQNKAIPDDNGIQQPPFVENVLLKLLFFFKIQGRDLALKLRVDFTAP